MTTRGAAIQGVLALVGLTGAYATWQREPERGAGEVEVLSVNRRDLGKIRFEDSTRWVELEPAGGDGPVVWLRVGANTDSKQPERRLRGNEAAEKLLVRFAPLRASRALGALGSEKLKEFGLDAPKRKIEITVRGEKRSYSIGTSPYGVSDPYVRDDRSGQVFVLGGSLIGDLESASVRLVDRRLHDFKANEFDALTIAAGEKRRELVRAESSTQFSVKLASKRTPDRVDELAKNWHDKTWGLVPLDVLGQGETPSGGAPSIVARVDYRSRGKPLGWIELGRVAAAAPPSGVAPSTPSPVEVYARTEHTVGWVKLAGQSADSLLGEAEKIAAAE